MENVADKWRFIGKLVGLQPSLLNSLSTKHHNDDIECCTAVLDKWLENPPSGYPATWEGLIELLEDCKLPKVADKLKQVLSEAIM